MIIAVSGSAGVGKTTIAKAIAKKYKLKYFDLNAQIRKNKLYDGYDKKLRSYIVDIKKIRKFMSHLLKEEDNLVVDSHLSHFIDKKYIDLCVVVKCDIKILKKRLEKRGYNKAKIRENLDAEIFDVCLAEATELGHKVKAIDTTKGIGKQVDKLKVGKLKLRFL